VLAIGGIGEFEAEDLGVLFGLLETVARAGVGRLGLDDRDGHVRPIAEDVVGPLPRTAAAPLAGDDDTAIGEGDLLVEPVRLGVPPSGLKPGNDKTSTSVRFVRHDLLLRSPSVRVEEIRCHITPSFAEQGPAPNCTLANPALRPS